jgi:hypothetical protein
MAIMLVAFIGAVALVLSAAVTGVWTWLAASTDRARAQQEADVLSKLDPNTRAAGWLREIIDTRVARWHRRIFRTRKTQLQEFYGRSLARSMEPHPGITPLPSWIIVLALVIGSVAVLIIAIWAAANGRLGDSV